MKNLLFTFLSLLVLTTSCAEEQECCQALPTHYYDVAVINANAEDLLDPNTPGAMNPNGIRLFRLEGNKEIAVALKGGEALDSPHGVMPYEEGGRRLVRLFFDYQGLADKFVGIIQWDSDNRDTMVHQFNQTGKEKHLVRILHKGQTLWELGDSPAPFVTLEK